MVNIVKIILQGDNQVAQTVTTFEDRVIANGGTFEAGACLTSFLKSLGGTDNYGGVLEVRQDVAFPLNFSVGDIRDISKRSGTFSKTIVLAGTDNNNQILNHYYDVNIEAGTFNVATLTKCQVVQNNVVILDNALLQLVNVNKQQLTDAHEQIVNYEVIIKDTKAELFSTMNSAELNDLDFSDLDHYQTTTSIMSTFNNTVADGYKYVLPYATNGNEYHMRQMKPAIYAKTYFDRIFNTAGFTYQWDDLSVARFDKLLIPYNGDENSLNWDDYKVKASKVFTTTNTQPANGSFNPYLNLISNWTEISDPQSIFNPTTGVYTAPTDTDPLASQYYNYEINITYEVKFNNTGANPVRPYQLVNGIYVPVTKSFTPYLKALTSTPFGTNANLTPVTINTTIPAGVSTFGTYSNTVITTPSGTILTGAPITLRLGLSSSWQSGVNYWRTSTGVFTQVDVNINVTSIQIQITPNSNTPVIGGFLNMNEYVPQKIKQSDFVKSIFQMYNLFADVDPEQPNNIILRHRDEYYDNGTEKDWTYKLAKDREQNLEFLPDVSNKRVILTYKQDTDDPNVLYKQSTDEIYGQQEYIFDSEYVRDIDTKELIFSPTPIAKTTFGAIVPMINGQTPKTNIRILYDGGEQPCGAWNLIASGVTGTYGILEYPAITHFDNANTPSFDLNFGTCDFYYYNPATLTNNNLWNLYWRRTVNQINVGKMLTAYFYLNEGDIHSLKLNDKIRIDNSWWNINKVIDYNANLNQLTKVELISVDTEIDLAPFQTNTGNPAPSTTTNTALMSVRSSAMNSANVILESSNVAVYGTRNSIAQNVRGVVIGNDQTLNEDGIITPRINGQAIQIEGYVGNLTQVGTGIPTSTVMASTFDVTWLRLSAGQYQGRPSITLNSVNTFVMINNVNHDHLTSAFIGNDGLIYIITCNTSGHAHEDGILLNSTLEIRTY
jgi:hypothetical protein